MRGLHNVVTVAVLSVECDHQLDKTPTIHDRATSVTSRNRIVHRLVRTDQCV